MGASINDHVRFSIHRYVVITVVRKEHLLEDLQV